MVVLQIHNAYKHFGGEDVVAQLEIDLLLANNIKVHTLAFNNDNVNPTQVFYNKESYQKVEAFILKYKPDILHVHNLFYKATPSVLKCAYDNNLPVVMTLHNYRLICPNGLLMRDSKPCLKCINKSFAIDAVIHNCFQDSKPKTLLLSSILYYHNKKLTWNKYVNKFIVLTPFAKNMFLKSSIKIDEQQIVVKPNSVDDLENKDQIKRTVYTYIGRLSNEKGIEIAVKAFNQLPNQELHIIGSGPQEDEMKKISNSNIKFFGRKPKEFIKQQLHKTKALIFSSICYEGLPNTILEAYSSSTPVIASDIENINSIVEDNITGILFKTNNPKSLAEAVIKFETKASITYNKNARHKYLNNYTHQNNYQSLIKLYKETIEDHKTNHYNPVEL